MYFKNLSFAAYKENGEVLFPLDPIYKALTGDGAFRTGYIDGIDTQYYANKFRESADFRISSIMCHSLRIVDSEECLPIVPFAIWLLFYFDFKLYERNYIMYAGYVQDLLTQYPDLPGRIEAFIDVELRKIENADPFRSALEQIRKELNTKEE